eukprot:g8680.t1
MSSDGEYVKYNTPTRFKTAPLRDPYKKVVSRALTKRAGKAQNRQNGNNQNISSLRSKLKKEQARKKDLEHKLQVALAQNTGNINRVSSLPKSKTSGRGKGFSTRRMHRHPRDMEDDLLYAEDRFMEVQANAERLENILESVQLELATKTKALEKSEAKVSTLLSMLQDLLSRLAKKELGDTYSEEDIGIQNRVWEEPLHAHFLEEGAIDNYIDSKIEKIQLALDQAVHDDSSQKADISGKTSQQPDSIGGILSSPIRSGTKSENLYTGQKINILSIKNFWAQISQLFSGKDILTLNEVEEAIFQLCGMDEKICQTFINHLSGFIPIDIRGDFVFGEEEFVALIQRCTDDVIINFFV